MSKTQIQQLVVIVLLILFGVVWGLSRKTAPPAPVVTLAPLADPVPGAPSPLLPGQETLNDEPDWIPLVRDPFVLPSRLLDVVRQKEEERRLQEELRNLPQQEKPISAPKPGLKPVDLSSFQLQALFWNTPRPQAIINRKTLSVGDEIESGKVTSISKEGVVLSLDGRETLLKPESGVRVEQEK